MNARVAACRPRLPVDAIASCACERKDAPQTTAETATRAQGQREPIGERSNESRIQTRRTTLLALLPVGLSDRLEHYEVLDGDGVACTMYRKGFS